MKHTSIFVAVSVALCAAAALGTGCSSTSSTAGTGGTTASSSSGSTSSTGSSSSSTSTSTSSSSSSGSGTGGSAFPAPPTIGTQIDRIGRPAVNTALNHGFDSTTAAGTAKDAYNADGTPTGWKAAYTAQFEANLAIIDALDGVCGNQLGYASGGVDGGTGASYGLLAGALTDDELYVNTAGTTCTQYLAVEANALAVAVNSDCGGRMPGYVVMDTTYSVLAIGALTGVKNGVEANNVAFPATFPYEAAPN